MENKQYKLNMMSLFLFLSITIFSIFGYLNFEDININSWYGIILMIIEQLAIAAIPIIFIMLGIKLIHIKLNAHYYFELFYLILYYNIIGLITQVVTLVINHEAIHFTEIIQNLFAYNDSPLGWCIDIIICIYCLAPILNKTFMSAKNDKYATLYYKIIFIGLTILPICVNSVAKVFPMYIVALAPVMFYIFGNAVDEKLVYRRTHLNFIIAFIVILFVSTVVNVNLYYNHTLPIPKFNNAFDLFSIGLAICLTGIIIKIKKVNNIINYLGKIASKTWFANLLIAPCLLEMLKLINWDFSVSLVNIVILFILITIVSMGISWIISKFINKICQKIDNHLFK